MIQASGLDSQTHESLRSICPWLVVVSHFIDRNVIPFLTTMFCPGDDGTLAVAAYDKYGVL